MGERRKMILIFSWILSKLFPELSEDFIGLHSSSLNPKTRCSLSSASSASSPPCAHVGSTLFD